MTVRSDDAGDGIRVLTLDRPERLNALTAAMELRYHQLLEAADRDPAVRAVVVTGAGRGFCAGFDLDVSANGTADGTPATWDPAATYPPGFPMTVGLPMVAALNGATAGIGLAHALYCDVRFAAAGARITTAFARRGLIAEYGTSWLLAQICGRGVALDLLLSGRTIVAEEALELGLVHRVLPAEEVLPAALDYARELATRSSPISMQVIKRQVLLDGASGWPEALERSVVEMRTSLSRPDPTEGIGSYLERRPPSFPARAR